MKKYVLLLLTAFAMLTGKAQSYESSIQYDKKKQQAITNDYSYRSEAVENAIVQKFAAMGYKAKEEKGILNRDKGFLVYKNIFIPDISKDRMDVMVKVERKSRRESDAAILYLVLLRDDKNMLMSMDAETAGRAKAFVNGLLPEVEAADLELQIREQEEVVGKAEKKLRDLRDEQASLEKKLEDNKNSQEATQKDIENQKQALGVLVGKRKEK